MTREGLKYEQLLIDFMGLLHPFRNLKASLIAWKRPVNYSKYLILKSHTSLESYGYEKMIFHLWMN